MGIKRSSIPSFVSPQVSFVQNQIKKTGVPTIKIDKYGIARDQYGNKYYKPHGSNDNVLDPNQGGYWSHVKSGNVGWNETPYKEQEIKNLSLHNGILPALGSMLRTPENALNAVLSGNYEPWSVSRRRLSDPNFNPNSGTGVAMDIFGDPAILKSLGELGIKKIPQLAEYAQQAGKYIANKATIAAQFAAKYGKQALEHFGQYGIKGIHAMGWALEHGASAVEAAGAFKSALGHIDSKSVNEDGQPTAKTKSVTGYQGVPFNISNNQSTPNQSVIQNHQSVINPSYNNQSAYTPQNARRVTATDKSVDIPNYSHLISKGGDNNSIVDLLKSNGLDSNYNNRKQLASQLGISDYAGTMDQNIKLKSLLQKKQQGGILNNEPNTMQRLKTYSQLMAEGGMPQQPQEQQQDQQAQIQQIVQQVEQMLQQGADPQEVLQQLVKMGIPQEQAQQVIQQVMAQMQQPQEQQEQPGMEQQEQPQQGQMRLGGRYRMPIIQSYQG